MGPIHASQTSQVQPLSQARGRARGREHAAPEQGPAVVLDLSPQAQAHIALGVDEAKLPVQPVPPVFGAEEPLEELEELEQELKVAQAKEEAEETKAAEEGEEETLDGLSAEEQAQVKAMAARDAEVRTHEQAHKAVGGALAGSITYSTEKGPDGKDYVIGGHVPIDVSPGSSPEETIQKASRIQAAALAPADPSPADKSVAAKAAQMGSEARVAAADQARAQTKESEAEAEAPASTPASSGQASATSAPQAAQALRPPGLAKAAAQYARWAA